MVFYAIVMGLISGLSGAFQETGSGRELSEQEVALIETIEELEMGLLAKGINPDTITKADLVTFIEEKQRANPKQAAQYEKFQEKIRNFKQARESRGEGGST